MYQKVKCDGTRKYPLCVFPWSGNPDENMRPFGLSNQHFQMLGNQCFDCNLEGLGEQKSLADVPDMLSTPSSSERHKLMMAQFIGDCSVSVC